MIVYQGMLMPDGKKDAKINLPHVCVFDTRVKRQFRLLIAL